MRNLCEWIENEGKEKWGVLLERDGCGYGIMRRNLGEV